MHDRGTLEPRQRRNGVFNTREDGDVNFAQAPDRGVAGGLFHRLDHHGLAMFVAAEGDCLRHLELDLACLGFIRTVATEVATHQNRIDLGRFQQHVDEAMKIPHQRSINTRKIDGVVRFVVSQEWPHRLSCGLGENGHLEPGFDHRVTRHNSMATTISNDANATAPERLAGA